MRGDLKLDFRLNMEPLEDEFGDIIQKARTGLGLTVRQVAEKAGITVSLLEKMESYNHMPSEKEAKVVAGVLSLNPEKLYSIAAGLWHPAGRQAEEMSDVIPIAGFIGSYRVNGYILYDSASKEAAIFDTANDSKAVLRNIKERGLKLRYIFLTHCHSDHIGGLRDISDATGADICLPEGEPSAGVATDRKGGERTVRDGIEFRLGSATDIRVVSTSGHTRGSTCYLTKNYCFSGDTLFAGSVGRSYSCEGYSALLKNVKEKILSLRRNVCIFPGHGPVTTVGDETDHNPFF